MHMSRQRCAAYPSIMYHNLNFVYYIFCCMCQQRLLQPMYINTYTRIDTYVSEHACTVHTQVYFCLTVTVTVMMMMVMMKMKMAKMIMMDGDGDGPGGATPEYVLEPDDTCAPRNFTACSNSVGHSLYIADSCLWLTAGCSETHSSLC